MYTDAKPKRDTGKSVAARQRRECEPYYIPLGGRSTWTRGKRERWKEKENRMRERERNGPAKGVEGAGQEATKH